MDIHVELPEATEQRIKVAEYLVRDVGEELHEAGIELYGIGCVPADVWWIFTHRALGPQIASVTISHEDLAKHGLSNHPRVVGVRWSDHGFAETVKCRHCVELTRHEYVDLEEAGTNELLYEPLPCHFCDAGHEDEDQDEIVREGSG